MEAELVGALELDVLSGEDEVLGLGREAGGDGGGFLDMGVGEKLRNENGKIEGITSST